MQQGGSVAKRLHGREAMGDSLKKRLEQKPVAASAPCRIDMGGTLDISTLHFPLRRLMPCTFNIALDLRTQVRLVPHRAGRVKVSSRGFPDADFPADSMPFHHPLGLMFAVAAYFGGDGVHVKIESDSPPRSALGGSSTAAVALVAAFAEACAGPETPAFGKRDTVLLAQALEASVAGVPCGFQDQLAAAYGGVNAWYWTGELGKSPFRRRVVVPAAHCRRMEDHLLLAYCGRPHESKDINGTWVRRFLDGKDRQDWIEMLRLTHRFIAALKRRDISGAVTAMNRETRIRRRITPDVVDAVGEQLVRAALDGHCGARFTGAGGGGCLWAIGEPTDIRQLEIRWRDITSAAPGARILDLHIDSNGLMVND